MRLDKRYSYHSRIRKRRMGRRAACVTYRYIIATSYASNWTLTKLPLVLGIGKQDGYFAHGVQEVAL